MQIANEVHIERPWRVHGIASDFELLDVWLFPIEGRADEFGRFVRMQETGFAEGSTQGSGAAAQLFRLRNWLGEVFGWDDVAPQPIPGCKELRVRDRIPEDERDLSPLEGPFDRVYRRDDECLLEIQNSTVHALMHLGWVEHQGGFAPEMAVYVKPHGLLGRIYRRVIEPFRNWIVYPALMRQVRKQWAAEARRLHERPPLPQEKSTQPPDCEAAPGTEPKEIFGLLGAFLLAGVVLRRRTSSARRGS